MKAVLTYSGSNGQVEGQAKRLKQLNANCIAGKVFAFYARWFLDQDLLRERLTWFLVKPVFL